MPQIWKISPGEGADKWPECRELGCIVMGWRRLRNYRRFGHDKLAIVRVLGGGYGNGKGAARSILQFAYEVAPSDIVVANRGRTWVEGIGIVTGDYLSPRSRGNPMARDEWFPHARKVDWIVQEPVYLGKAFFAASALTRLRPSKVNQIRRAYARRHPALSKALDRLFARLQIDERGSIETPKLLKTAKRKLADEGAFDPHSVRDARVRTVASIVRRQGQPAFRRKLLEAYDRRCAVTGCGVEEILEAAHIVPYQGSTTDHVGNGVLLRADVHTLFDLYLVTIDDKTLRLRMSPRLKGSAYEEYHGRKVKLPRRTAIRPSREALQDHFARFEAELER